jgi:COPII coat assembly protein SEC16
MSSGSYNPYTPSLHPQRQASELSDYGEYQSRYGYPEPDKAQTYDHHPVQEVTLSAPHVYGAYAPSPTLLGANDPLGRTAARAPVFSFGAGGRFVTCFHGSGTLNTGFDVALASRQSTDIRIQKLHEIIPPSALDTSEVSFPGPLFNDPGTPTTGLVGTGAAARTKAKKAKVLQYLEDRANEIDRGLGYINQDSVEHKHAEGKLVLVRLLKVMVDNDGKLTGR